MQIVRDSDQLVSWKRAISGRAGRLGFVPTMGALHQGHFSLVEQARESCDHVVVSIFVNPTQFNDPKDLENYPRMPEQDAEALRALGVDTLFLPSAELVYPEGFQWQDIDLGLLDRVLEGPNRPGHFQGVAMVVDRLFSLVSPDMAFFGRKDLQQVAVIRRMVEVMGHGTTIVALPTVREVSGLAMSSRNLRLSGVGREQAARIFQVLCTAREMTSEHTPEQVSAWAFSTLDASPGLECEYAQVVDDCSFQSLEHWTPGSALCVAVWCEGVRLIDNLSLIP